MSYKIFFGNYKGGVGKTTSTYNMAIELSKQHKRKILLFDLDPQSSLSEVCMTACKKQLDELKRNETLNYIYSVYMQARKIEGIKFTINSNSIIKTTNYVDFIPNSLFSEIGGLDKISIDIGENVNNLLILHDFIEENKLNEKYDFIFFDCPPSNNIITQSAFLYSDYYIIPTIMDSLSSKGVKHYISVVDGIYQKYCRDSEYSDVLSVLFGDKPKLIGIFETMRKGPTDTSYYKNLISPLGYIFNAEIKNRKNVSETMGEGIEVSSYEYFDLVEEFLQRLSDMEGNR